MGEVEVELYSFLNLKLRGAELSASRPRRLTPT